MKKTLSIVLCIVMFLTIVPLTSFAGTGKTYYIDSVAGDDSALGINQAEAWKTTANIQSLALAPGDKVLFKCGGEYECALTLTCSGTEDEPIVLSSYGEGDKPLLYTSGNTDILRLFDCSYVTVSDLEMTAHNGGGIWIDTLTEASYGITVANVDFHDMQNYKVTSRDNFSYGAAAARACIMIKGLPARSKYTVNDLTVIGCEMYDCGNGVIIWGAWNPEKDPWSDREDEIEFYFNTGVLVEDCYFHDMDAEAVVVGICDGALVTNCRSINCCQGEGVDENGKVLYYTAAMWFWGSKDSTIQYCEVAGQKNVGDGMTVDFDSYSNGCTYQYVYSHDNMRFIVNNAKQVAQRDNTVRYCLSVNDGAKGNIMASSTGEYNFKFYNNTIIGCDYFRMMYLKDSLVANNIFVPKRISKFNFDLQEIRESGTVYTNNCYYDMKTPLYEWGAINALPGFVSDDWSNPASFMLSADSPLIGAGLAIAEADTDFFGNAITSNNIGCYAGIGTDSAYQREGLICRLFRTVRYIVEFVYETIAEEIIYISKKIDKKKQS